MHTFYDIFQGGYIDINNNNIFIIIVTQYHIINIYYIWCNIKTKQNYTFEKVPTADPELSYEN